MAILLLYICPLKDATPLREIDRAWFDLLAYEFQFVSGPVGGTAAGFIPVYESERAVKCAGDTVCSHCIADLEDISLPCHFLQKLCNLGRGSRVKGTNADQIKRPCSAVFFFFLENQVSWGAVPEEKVFSRLVDDGSLYNTGNRFRDGFDVQEGAKPEGNVSSHELIGYVRKILHVFEANEGLGEFF